LPKNEIAFLIIKLSNVIITALGSWAQIPTNP
jgi:hypothetical protein